MGLGFEPPADVQQWDTRRALLARYVLWSEFAFDLPGDLPDALAHLPRADESYREHIYAIGGRLRDTGSYREAYIELAQRVEQELQLASHFARVAELGQRDTFAFQERRDGGLQRRRAEDLRSSGRIQDTGRVPFQETDHDLDGTQRVIRSVASHGQRLYVHGRELSRREEAI